LAIDLSTFGTEPYLITLGNHVEVTEGVRFVTHDGGVWRFRQEFSNIDVFGPIALEDNVYVGLNTILLPGVRVGHDSIIGAGSVVTRSIPPDSVAAGVPARVIETVEQYRQKVMAKALYIRDLEPAEKRKYLLRHFSEEMKSQTSNSGEP
jgi:acetyltransferase-like isoleucine patch superfamily enzyme